MSELEEELVKELQGLGKRKPLGQNDMARARAIMVDLKKRDWTAEEIAEISDGGWSVYSVRNYVKGVNAEDTSSKERIVGLITQVIREGLAFDDIRGTINALTKISSFGIGLEDIAMAINESMKAKISVAQFVKIAIDFAGSGISAPRVTELLTFKAQLDASGLGFENAKLLAATSKNYGSVDEVINAVREFGSLKAIEKSNSVAKGVANKIAETIKVLEKQKAELEGRQSTIQSALDAYAALAGMGYDEEVLKKLATASGKFGGPKGVLEAVSKYARLQTLERAVEETEGKVRGATTELKQLQADHNHLAPIIGMTEALMYTFKLNQQSIADLLKVARIYGDPLAILQAVEKYGSLKKIDADIEKSEARAEELVARVRSLETELGKLRGLLDDEERVASGILVPFTDGLAVNAKLLSTTFSGAVEEISAKFYEFIEKFGSLNAEAGKLEAELAVARVFLALRMYPAESKDIPIQWGEQLVGAALMLCRTKGLNQKLIPPAEIRNRNFNLSEMTLVPLQDLLEWALRGLVPAPTKG